MRLETIAVHAGHVPDLTTGAVTPPIHLSTTFEREPDLSFRGGHLYARYSNPNRVALEACLAQLEGGGAAACFAQLRVEGGQVPHQRSSPPAIT